MVYELHNAAADGDVNLVRRLLDRGYEIDDQHFEERKTPLHIAVEYGHKNVVKLLLDRGANPTIANYRGTTPLMGWETLVMKPEIVKHLLEKSNIHQKNRQGLTALHHHISRRDHGASQQLLQHGADVNAKGHVGITPLMLAETPQNVELLLRHGANIHHANDNGMTPLHWAVYHTVHHANEGNMSVVEELLKRGANIHRRHHEGRTAENISRHLNSEQKLGTSDLTRALENARVSHAKRHASFMSHGYVDPRRHSDDDFVRRHNPAQGVKRKR